MTPTQKLDFYNKCVILVKNLTKKLVERSPLKYPLVRNMTCLNPSYMVKNERSSSEKFSGILMVLMDLGWYSAEKCDNAKAEYRQLLTDLIANHKQECKTYDHRKMSLDSFFFGIVGNDLQKVNVWMIIRHLLTLSHGQAAVERGFSVNKDILSVNLQKQTLKAMRTVTDALNNLGSKVEDFVVTKDILQSCKSSYTRYNLFLEEKKKAKEQRNFERKRKQAEEELADAKKMKLSLEKVKTKLLKDADEKAFRAEKKNNFGLLVQSNAFRAKAAEKDKEIEKKSSKIEQLELKIKQSDN